MLIDNPKAINKKYEQVYKEPIPRKFLEILTDLNNYQSKLIDSLQENERNAFMKLIKEFSPIPFSEEYIKDVDQLLYKISGSMKTYNYDDLEDRLTYFIVLKESLKELSTVPENVVGKGFIRVSVMLYDAIRKIKAEDVSKKQYDVINSICKKLIDKNIKDKDFVKFDRCLLDVGIDWAMGNK
ncbi:hypothetical protein Q0N30_12385 [Priestia megaterium]|uniref:hypothetical protein n=1 Tax=Priestia megaterium TaxID=1404 RepID=UPI003458BF5D